jgi:hypothetical protein
MADIRRQYRGKKAATTDRRIISRARVIDGAAVVKAREEKASQAAARAEVKERRAAVRAEAAKRKAARAAPTKAKGKGKVVSVADALVAPPKKSRQPRKVLVSILKVWLMM